MLTAERRQYILDALRRDGKVLASDLSAALNTSEDTIRRDLRELAEARLLQRVHGGALPRSPTTGSYAMRREQPSAAKSAIAQAAAQLVRHGHVVILDGGTTTLEIARRLPPDLRATIVTNSPPIVVALAEHPCVNVVIIGGQLAKEPLVAVGAATIEALHMIRADMCMLGTCGLHPEAGISVTVLEEAHVKRAMVAGAAEVIALATADKLGAAGPYIVGPISELTHIVTEKNLPEEMIAPYRALGITIVQD